MSSLFIGLGGFGTRTLDCLSEKMDAYNQDMIRLGEPEVNACYYYLDTDSTRYNESPLEFQGMCKKFHRIGLYSPDQIINGMRRGGGEQYDLLNKWYDAYSKATTMNIWADCVRQYARLGFAAEAPAIRQELVPLIQRVTQQNGRIYVITSSCGGTGSGIYLDLLYMISEIYECISTLAMSTDVRLVMAMPEGYISNGYRPLDVANMKMRLNAFATLEELNAVCKEKDTMPSRFNGCYVGSYKKNGPFQPFRFGYLYDTADKSIGESCKDLSEFLFELEFAGDTNTNNCAAYIGSYFDSLLTGTVDGNWNSSINDEYVKAFNALGRYSIEKPDFLYKKYFSDRLLFDVFHIGLLGENKTVDEVLVCDLAAHFMDDCNNQISLAHDKITARFLSRDIFDNDFQAAAMFSVFTNYPDTSLPEVKQIVEAKNVLLEEIKAKVYNQCKKWLWKYDFATVYAVLERLDVDFYAHALNINQDYAEMLDKAKEASRGGFLRRHIQPQRAMDQFRQMLSVWLSFEVSKALSSGRDVDIDVQNHGYLDYCKQFVEIAKGNFSLEKEQEHWNERFIKEVGTLKYKENTSFIPNLDTLVDNHCNIVPDSLMVVTYDSVVIGDPAQADFTQGTCTLVMLHQRVMEEMRNNVDDCNLDELFDPTPGNAKSLYARSNSMLFVEKYVAAAKKQIDILLEANESYHSLFAGDILSRLQQLSQLERSMICMKYAEYDKVQMKTTDLPNDAVTTYTCHIISNTHNLSLMQDLGIQRGCNSDIIANPSFADKIVKLIVKTGYKIDYYRYFEVYKEFAKREINVRCHYDPFIDKRFLGVPDKDGKYPCDVSAALEKIEQSKTYSLDGYNDVEIYKYCLALLYEYFDALKQGGHIVSDFENAISHIANTTTIDFRQLVYNMLRMKYTLEESQTIDLASLSSMNDMKDLTIWIQYVLSKKVFINNECWLYGKALEDFNLTLSSDLEEAIGDMMGEGNRPDYDFFNAYLDWYRKIYILTQ